MQRAQTIRLLLGDQLNPEHSWFQQTDDQVLYVLMEVRQETDYVQHHIQKVVGIFAAMRRFAQHLTERGHRVHYLTLDHSDNTQSIPENINKIIQQTGAKKFEYLLPDEYRLDEQLKSFCEQLAIETDVSDTEHFYTTRYEVKNFFSGKKTYLLENFYRAMRQKHRVLMDSDGEPVTGRWNFDTENRNKLPPEHTPPPPLTHQHNVTDLVELLEKQGVETIGTLEPEAFIWPLTAAEAKEALQDFIQRFLPNFGTYQDAMDERYWSIYHSRLSFALNIKLLNPREVVNAVEEAWRENPERYNIAQVEGFIRQVLGWREFMRGVYWAKMPAYAEQNYFGHPRKLPSWYWSGETKMNCLQKAIGQSLEHAYAHHIQRLMVTGNFALLAGIHPDEVDAWYLGIYIDAFQWVEITNTRGMSQFADGGLVASKPYVASANYMHKMSNYCQGCAYNRKKKTGPDACPFNSLYWHFMARHQDKLRKNPRIAKMYGTLQRMKPENRSAIMEKAEELLANLEDL